MIIKDRTFVISGGYAAPLLLFLAQFVADNRD